jgi:hypothetical protein
MDSIQSYLNKTHSAVEKVYAAVHSYYELLFFPERPSYFTWTHDEHEQEKEYQKWRLQNKEKIEERLKRDTEFAAETFAITTLCGTILQFAYMGIKLFSRNTHVPADFQDLIQPDQTAARFCIGRIVDDVPLGLIVYAGRNQAHHYDERRYNAPTSAVFSKLAHWYSPTFKKSFVDDRFDLTNERITNFADQILDKLDWQNCISYEKDMLELFPERGTFQSH